MKQFMTLHAFEEHFIRRGAVPRRRRIIGARLSAIKAQSYVIRLYSVSLPGRLINILDNHTTILIVPG